MALIDWLIMIDWLNSVVSVSQEGSPRR